MLLMALSIFLSLYLLREDNIHNFFYKSVSKADSILDNQNNNLNKETENKVDEIYVNQSVNKHIETLENEVQLTLTDNEHEHENEFDKEDEGFLRTDCKKNLKIKFRKNK